MQLVQQLAETLRTKDAETNSHAWLGIDHADACAQCYKLNLCILIKDHACRTLFYGDIGDPVVHIKSTTTAILQGWSHFPSSVLRTGLDQFY